MTQNKNYFQYYIIFIYTKVAKSKNQKNHKNQFFSIDFVYTHLVRTEHYCATVRYIFSKNMDIRILNTDIHIPGMPDKDKLIMVSQINHRKGGIIVFL
jgi:hypothetical protein